MSKKNRHKHQSQQPLPEPNYSPQELAQREGLRQAQARVSQQESPYYQHRMGHISKKERAQERARYQQIDEARRHKEQIKLDNTPHSTKKEKIRFIKHNQ